MRRGPTGGAAGGTPATGAEKARHRRGHAGAAQPRRRPQRHGARARPEGDATSPPPEDTIGRRAAAALEAQRWEMSHHVGSALDGRDPEGVHDMRVASRRLRAALQLFAPWIADRERRRLEPAMRRVTRALGRVRELDVLRLRLADLARRARPERALAIESIDARLARRRRRARARMMAEFAKVDLDRLDRRLNRCAAHLVASGTPPAPLARPSPGAGSDITDVGASGDAAGEAGAAAAAAPPTGTTAAGPDGAGETPAAGDDQVAAHAPVAELLWVAAPEVVTAARDALDHPVPPEVGTAESAIALHEIRIAAKKLRYLLEILAPQIGAPASGLIKQLKRLQDRLGDFHDDTVLDDALRDAIARAAERDRPLLAAELRRFRALRRRSLARDERGVRAALETLRTDHLAAQIERALAAAGVPAERLAGEAASGNGASDAGAVVVEAATPAGATGRPARGSRGRRHVRRAAGTENPGWPTSDSR